MHCPRCHQSIHDLAQPCPACQFSGDLALVEELAHVEWVLDEIEGWPALGVDEEERDRLQREYAARRGELQVALGLRLPPFSEEEARQAWPLLFHCEALLAQAAEWQLADRLTAEAADRLVTQVKDQVDALLEQLEGYARPKYPRNDVERLEMVRFLLEAVDHLSQEEGFVTAEAEEQIRTDLLVEKEKLESILGLRPATDVGEELHAAEVAHAPEDVAPPSVAPTPSPPPVPLRERLGQALISERTLQAILFLGIFLLFAAALSFVIWGWRNFSAPLRVAIPTGFTVLFFVLGRYVHTHTPLQRSGIALYAIAALLIPIDFYTIYANFDIPARYWPSFWLAASLFCLAAYVAATFTVHSRFFGYLVGTAAGSLVLASIQVVHQAFGFSLDWRTAGLSCLALGLVAAAGALARLPQGTRLQLLVEPFRYLALLTVGVLMPLAFGWRFIDRAGYDTLHDALTINWWVGSLIFAWGAVHHRSRSLALLSAIALPVAVYLTEAAMFERAGASFGWYALGWAGLVPFYILAAHGLRTRTEDVVLHAQGRIAVWGGIVLLVIVTQWPLADLAHGAAAAASHAVLSGSVLLAAFLWRRPAYLYAASLLSLSASSFAMSQLGLTLAQLSVGWASLSLVHLLVVLGVGARFPAPAADFARPLVVGGYAVAALALLPPLFPYDGDLLVYAMGHWLGLAAWGARLAHTGQPGFAGQRGWRKSVFHWLAALPLPLWLGLLFLNRRPLDFSLPLALAALAWGMAALGYRLGRVESWYGWPWRVGGLLVSVAAPAVAWAVVPFSFTLPATILAAGVLYFVDALVHRQSIELAPAALVTAGGCWLLLDRLRLSFDAVTLALAALVALYFLAGLCAERRKPAAATHRFLAPLYLAAHLLTLLVLGRIYVRPFDALFFDVAWTDAMRIWGAAAQLLLGGVYGLYAWGTYRERWGHVAAWLGAAGGGFIVISYSTGRGSSAVKAALMAFVCVLAERGLHWLRERAPPRRLRAWARLAWWLYRRPLLVTGWTVSAGVIGLALIRNLWLLGGGRIQQTWAAAGLLLITGLYALSARLFRQARFAWLAALLVIAPWAILTNLGWFTVYRPTPPGFGLSWVLLAWLLFVLYLLLSRLAPPAYALPLQAVAHALLPLALLWGLADVDTSRFTFGLAVALYGTAALLDLRRLKQANGKVSILQATKFIYPALGLVPVWCVYLLTWLLPAARHEHYGLLLLVFGPLGMLAGRWLERHIALQATGARGYGLPGYLTAYVSLIVGTMLVAHVAALLALVLLFNALLMLMSARLFRNPLWIYPAAAMPPVSLLIALREASIPGDRHGWWLIGLAAVYLGLAWALRRVRLPAYGIGVLAMGFALVALGLPPSSQDQIGAFWGYSSAALLYAIAAFWLRQPLLLTPASALVIVPYVVGLERSPCRPEYYGLALFPGALVALALGWLLDRHFGDRRAFPWENPSGWAVALAKRLTEWWALPLYTLGFGLALFSPVFTSGRTELTALNCLLLVPLFAWAVYRFRLRAWLLAMALAGHLAAVYLLEAWGWWHYPAWAWLRFLPVILVTALAGLAVERYRGEGSPLHPERLVRGWSRPLYALAALDVMIAQAGSLEGTWAAAAVTLAHALLIACFASAWSSSWLAYLSAALGVVSLGQWWMFLDEPAERLPVMLARMALGYGMVGCALALGRDYLKERRVWPAWMGIWEGPLQRAGMALSFGVWALTAWLGVDLVGWSLRAMLGFSFRRIVDLATVRMAVGVLSWLGLLYVAIALVHRRLRLGYVAVGMLLIGWMLHAFYVQQWDSAARVQWYAIPAGLYLLGVAYLEWQRGNRALARWLDYAAMLLMLGSLFWQTLLYGWRYAVLLGAEGFLFVWWGSSRRLRRFLYAGMMGVILATLGQLINSLWSINQWIVFGFVGLCLVVIAVIVERRLEDIQTWQEVLESWE